MTASLPQLDGRTFITDGGMETVLIFHEGLELPAFASFVLLDDETGRETLRDYWQDIPQQLRDDARAVARGSKKSRRVHKLSRVANLRI